MLAIKKHLSIKDLKSTNRLVVTEFDADSECPYDMAYNMWDLKLAYKDDNNWSLAGIVDGYASVLIVCERSKLFSYHAAIINDTFFVDNFETFDFGLNAMKALIEERNLDALFGPVESIDITVLRGE